jgi:SAM-dependent methyltransferase
MAKLYDSADLFVLPSLFEGYGMAYAEALAHGLPVLGSRAGAIPDTVPADAGLLVEPGSTSALAAALERLITDQELRERLAAGARRARAGCRPGKISARCFAAAARPCLTSATNGSRCVLGPTAAPAPTPWCSGSDRSRAGIEVLDLGCGTGANLRHLAPLLAAAGAREQRWTCIDLDSALLDKLPARSADWAAENGLDFIAETGGFGLTAPALPAYQAAPLATAPVGAAACGRCNWTWQPRRTGYRCRAAALSPPPPCSIWSPHPGSTPYCVVVTMPAASCCSRSATTVAAR